MLNQKTLRKKKTQKDYMSFLKTKKTGCFICAREMVRGEFKNFILIENRFPYDKIFAQHLLLCPKRHLSKISQLSILELKELEKILTTLDYDMAIWNSLKCQSHQGHIHLHICTLYK
jgi:diadenosine tetraphosphate (Ap4A) HIT family hydrolase